MGRDALTADILLKDGAQPAKKQDVVRVCTTHLESEYFGRVYRPGQLALTSTLLKHNMQMSQNVVAGLVAGDMNAIDKFEHEYPKADDVRLQDAWENGPEGEVPRLKPFQRDVTNGQARGNTWGYQRANGKRDGKRMDKILYTGAPKYIPLSFGTNRKQFPFAGVAGGLKNPAKDAFLIDPPSWVKDAVLTTTPAWVSDHYGILAKFQVGASANNSKSQHAGSFETEMPAIVTET
ncbi:Hypothetical predicted protein [Lecanosticta acicola]|uniref:Uncharacterized protein n=1 Tax=Lecanosticta acicola TaxID=111012 RepID=A0AAI8YZV1_9PEZI|nr:Hypothetical predicted protein [Lecanosticta acicola]